MHIVANADRPPLCGETADTGSDAIDLDRLPAFLEAGNWPQWRPHLCPECLVAAVGQLPPDHALDALERAADTLRLRLLKEALEDEHGAVKRAAVRLGRPERTVWRWIEVLGLSGWLAATFPVGGRQPPRGQDEE